MANVKNVQKDRKRIYAAWNSMKMRCRGYQDRYYRNYTLRGITVCDEWLNNFDAFYTWAINNGYQENLSLDRIDNDKGYSPQNCRWATPKEQMNNVRYNRILTLDNISHTLSEWGNITGMNWTTIQSRKRRGWSDEDALMTPEGKQRVHDGRIGKEELSAIVNDAIANGICVNKMDFIRQTGIVESSFFYTLEGKRKLSKENSQKIRRFLESKRRKNEE